MELALKENEILVLRTCYDAYGYSYNNFLWPKSGSVEAPDWRCDCYCGGGLHGLPWGVGGASYLTWSGNNGWVVKVDVSPENYKHGRGDLADKCKFHKGEVVLGGASREKCIALIQKYAPKDAAINWANQVGGDNSTFIGGSCCIQQSGHQSNQKAGRSSVQFAGYNSYQTALKEANQTAGSNSVQVADAFSCQRAGECSRQTAGHNSIQKAGIWAIQIAGMNSVQKAITTATQTGGVDTIQIMEYKEGPSNHYTTKVRVITEKEADKPYLFKNGEWILA